MGIVVPVRNEESTLRASLQALMRAMRHPSLAGVAIEVAVVLDGCVDASPAIAAAAARQVHSADRKWHATVIATDVGNVGRARHLGCCRILERLEVSGPHATPNSVNGIWLSSTDADSAVPSHWLACQAEQRALGIEAWAGTVTVADWEGRPSAVSERFANRYQEVARGGGHIHGTSLGFGARAYLAAGGFPPLATGEDHALWRRLGDIGARRVHDLSCPVTTSARRRGRAPDGFCDTLNRFEDQLSEDSEHVD